MLLAVVVLKGGYGDGVMIMATAQGLTTHHSDTLAVLEASGCMRFYALSQQVACVCV